MAEPDVEHPSDRWLRENLAARRKAVGLSQERVAEEMTARGFPFAQATVWKIEAGTRRVRVAEAVALGEVLSGDAAEQMWRWTQLLEPPRIQRALTDLDQARQRLVEAYDDVARATVRALKARDSVLEAAHSFNVVAESFGKEGERPESFIPSEGPEVIAALARRDYEIERMTEDAGLSIGPQLHLEREYGELWERTMTEAQRAVAREASSPGRAQAQWNAALDAARSATKASDNSSALDPEGPYRSGPQ